MSSVESVAVDSAGTHAGSHVPVKALRSMAWGREGISWLLEEEEDGENHCRRCRRRSVWSAYRWILIRVVSKVKKGSSATPKPANSPSVIIQIVGFGLKNKKGGAVHCCYLHPIVPLSLLRYMQVTFYPYAPAGLYRSAIIAMQLCKQKPYQTIPPNLRFSFCYLLHCTLCGYLVILRRINRGERRYLFLFCAASF